MSVARVRPVPQVDLPPVARARLFMFPGQSSVAPGIVARALATHDAAAEIAEHARHVLGSTATDRWAQPDSPPPTTNHDVQVTVFLATQMYLAALAAEGIDAAASVGLSLGEYSHLVHIGAIDVDEALALVDERGRRYDEAPPGMMVTVLAVDHDTVAGVVADATTRGPVVISNYNTPTQHVIAGSAEAVTWAAAVLENEHAAHTAVIERCVPMHSPLMTGVAEAFRPALARTCWRAPLLPYLPNVTASPLIDPRAEDFVVHLTRHVSEPVQWRASIDGLVNRQPAGTFVEVGPGGVLHNMLGRAWRGRPRARTDAPEGADPREHFAATVEALRA